MLAYIETPLGTRMDIREIVESRNGILRGYLDRGIEIALPRDNDSIDYIHAKFKDAGLSRFCWYRFPTPTEYPNEVNFQGFIYIEQWILTKE